MTFIPRTIKNLKFLYNDVMSLNQQNVISGNNFSSCADVSFSERVSLSSFQKISKVIEYKIIQQIDNEFSSEVWFVNKKFTIKKNTTIFCKTELLDLLFLLLNHIPKEYELNLITHQSDIEINKKKFTKKPRCINQWFAVNVAYDNKNLHRIPLGISESFRKQHITVNHIKEMTNPLKVNKQESLYINFNPNTNKKIRHNILKVLKNQNFTTIGSYGLDVNDYIKEIKDSQYVLCPTGNGLDTYRLWETLIIGSNPVVNSTKQDSEFKNLPIYYFNNPKELTIEYLKSKNDTIQEMKNNNISREYLTTNYWMKDLNKNTLTNSELRDINIIIDSNIEKTYFRKFYISQTYKSNIKKVKYYLSQYLNIFNYFRFIYRKLKPGGDKKY